MKSILLMKTVLPNETEAGGKFKLSWSLQPGTTTLEQMARNIGFLANPLSRKIAIPIKEGIEILLLDEVYYFKADRNYTLVKRSGKKDLVISRPLKDFTVELEGTEFIRIHSSFLINMQKVVRYVRADGGYVVMEDGTEITVSRRHKDDFLRCINAG